MWYGDFAPPSGHHPKKPLSRKQIQKMREAYAQADGISAHIQELEQQEQEQFPPQKEVHDQLDQIFL